MEDSREQGHTADNTDTVHNFFEAIQQGQPDLVQYFLDSFPQECHAGTTDFSGKIAFELAEEIGNSEVIALLAAYRESISEPLRKGNSNISTASDSVLENRRATSFHRIRLSTRHIRANIWIKRSHNAENPQKLTQLSTPVMKRTISVDSVAKSVSEKRIRQFYSRCQERNQMPRRRQSLIRRRSTGTSEISRYSSRQLRTLLSDI